MARKPFRFWVRNRVYYVQYRAYPGKWKSTGQVTEDDAEIWALNHDPESGREQLTLREFTKDFFIPGNCEWLKRQKARGITYGPGHTEKMRRHLKNYILPEFGLFYLENISRRTIDDWLIDLNGKKSRKPLKADTKNAIITTFRHVMEEAVDQELVDQSPLDGLKPFRDLERTERAVFTLVELQVLFPENIEEMQRIWLSFEWAAYFYIMGTCGLRPGEVSALTWENWHRSLHGMVVTHSIEARTGRRKGTKTGIRKPAVLTKRAEGFLLLLESLSAKTKPKDLIFPGPDGKPIILETANKHFKASCDRAGVAVDGRTQYCLRHSFNTHTLHVLNRTDVQTFMGHRTDEMTEHYYHPTDADLLRKVSPDVREKLEKLWG